MEQLALTGSIDF